MTCEHAHEDAAYVLGALSSAERAAFQEHLAGCAECTQAVRRLSGLPGLLSRVSLDVLEEPTPEEPVPDTLLPALVAEARRHERRRSWTIAVAAAAAAIVLTGGGLVLGGVLSGEEAPPPAAAQEPMEPVADIPVTAEVGITEVDWGTRIDVTCSYPEPESGQARDWPYALVVRTREGGTERVASWVAKPGRTFNVSGATASPADDIETVEIQTLDGQPLLRLQVPS
jgi:hypothetical protein